MNATSKILVALLLICLPSIMLSPLTSLTLSSLFALGILAYVYLRSRRSRRARKEYSQQLKILIVLPREPKESRRSFNLKMIDRKSEVKAIGYKLVKPIKFYVIVSIATLSIATCILANTALPLLSLPLLAVTPYIPIIRQKFSESIRKHNVENELPFFSLLASALSHAGQTLTKAFNVVAEAGAFPALKLEALYLKKEELLVGRDPITAMNNYAQRHPSKLLSSLILGYTSIVKSGGDVTKYLEEKTRELFLILKDKWNSFVNGVSIVGEAMLALFLVTPLMLSMTVLVFANEVNVAFYELIIFGITPLLSLSTLYFIHITRPYESIEYAPSRKTIVLSLASFITSIVTSTLILNQPLFNVVIASSIAIALPLSISYEREKADVLKIERELPLFLRYLGEHKKLGFPILTAIERSSNERYSRTFSLVIKSALSKMKLGLSLYHSITTLKVRSKLCKIAFFTLDHLIETGGGSPATFEIMASCLEDYNVQRSKVRRSLYLYSVLGYLSPLILAVCLSLATSFMVGISEPVSLDLIEGSSTLAITPTQEEINSMLFYSKLMITISSIAIGITLGKAVDGTLFSTRHLLICTSVALITLNLLL